MVFDATELPRWPGWVCINALLSDNTTDPALSQMMAAVEDAALLSRNSGVMHATGILVGAMPTAPLQVSLVLCPACLLLCPPLARVFDAARAEYAEETTAMSPPSPFSVYDGGRDMPPEDDC